MELSIFRELMLSDGFEDIRADLSIFDNKECYFYYDESNNIRKLWLDENDFNAPVYSDFVLGGIMHFGNTCNADVDKLKSVLRLQKSANELKFKHISRQKHFLGCLSEPKVKLFLQWLFQSDLYVHYANINNLYWAIIDIVDTIEESGYIPFYFHMKNELYKLARANYLDFYQLLVKSNYPNITSSEIAPFYQGIIELIDTNYNELSFELEVLRQGMKAARKQSELVFLHGNTEKTVIDSYFPFYMRPIGVFPSAQHIFDNEYLIKEQFDKHELLYNGKKVDNYYFIDSKDNPLIQVSDCIVGLLGKYYTFINGISIREARQMLNTITPEQKSTLSLFAKLLKKSEDCSKLLFNSSESIEEHDVGEFIITHALIE